MFSPLPHSYIITPLLKQACSPYTLLIREVNKKVNMNTIMMPCMYFFQTQKNWRMSRNNIKLCDLTKRVSYLLRLSPQSGQIWGFLPCSSKTCNIYKPLKRINLESIGRAGPPITCTRPAGFVTVELMDLCDDEGFQSRCFGTRPSLEWLSPQQPTEGRRPEAELWQHFSQTVWCYFAP